MTQTLCHKWGPTLDRLQQVHVLSWEAQNSTQNSRCGLINAEWRGRIICLKLWATLLMQPRTPLAFAARASCWLMFNLVSPWNLRSFSAKLFPSCVARSIYCCMGLFLPRWRTSYFSTLNCPNHLLMLVTLVLLSLLLHCYISSWPKWIKLGPSHY